MSELPVYRETLTSRWFMQARILSLYASSYLLSAATVWQNI